MRPSFNDMSVMLAAARGPLAGWGRAMGAAALTVAIVGLEIWLRVPVRPAFNQLLLSRRQRPCGAWKRSTTACWR